MTQMPEFIEPHVIPEQLAADIGQAVAEAVDCTPAEALAALDAGKLIEQLHQAPPAEQHDYAPERDAEHEQAVPAAPPVPEQAPPEPMMAGTYAIYDDGAGGVWLVIGPREGGVIRKQIPAGMLKMAERFGGGFAGLLGGA